MKKKIYRDGKQATGCQRLEMGEGNTVSIKEGGRSFRAMEVIVPYHHYGGGYINIYF